MTIAEDTNPGLQAATEDSQGFVLNHSMLRVKDPERALAFYSRVFGMRLVRRLDFESMQFSLYFLAKLQPGETLPEEDGERTVWTFSQKGILELTHNWGTEEQDGQVYHNGNDAPQGFGHICFSVPDLDAAQAWFDANQVEFVKRADQGKMKNVIFVKDADDYWIEVVQANRLAPLGD